MKRQTLSGWEAARCDEHQFRAKIKVSAGAVLELSLFEKDEKWSEQRKWHFHYCTLLLSALPRGFWALI